MNLLEQLYNGNYCPSDKCDLNSSAYKLAQEEIQRAEDEVIETHRELYPRDLNKLHDSYSRLMSFYSETSFYDGIRFCARFLAEAFLGGLQHESES